ncbi:MAG: DNA repair protein RecO [Spirochaetes bacterium]|uniref:DNA repair protein RecO n=1 Tax=Candidatus Avitreponema avistercoris TaxID=2840705 RepID=A0A9D9HG30_9SPIR|nr:DNA repair protein RecO [Candidatus Avitreponema avistercoris]
MASRSWTSPAVVLQLASFGENHREASVFTPDKGLVKAAVFGGAKSRMRAAVNPFHAGQMWFYTDPVKKSTKITDFDVKKWRENIRGSLLKTWCASLCAEIVIRSKGAGDWNLVNGFLDGIHQTDERACRPAVLRFLWRMLSAAGFRVDIAHCARCGGQFSSGEDGRTVWYVPREDGCLCRACTAAAEKQFPLSAESRFYLQAAESCEPKISRALPLLPEDYGQLRDFLFFLTERMLGGKLKTVESGAGIL